MKTAKEQPKKIKEKKPKKRLLAEEGEVGSDLFEKLRGLRMELAKKDRVPPYLVFTDKTLTPQMCQLHPKTKEEMLMVSGVGEKMNFRRYGGSVPCASQRRKAGLRNVISKSGRRSRRQKKGMLRSRNPSGSFHGDGGGGRRRSRRGARNDRQDPFLSPGREAGADSDRRNRNDRQPEIQRYLPYQSQNDSLRGSGNSGRSVLPGGVLPLRYQRKCHRLSGRKPAGSLKTSTPPPATTTAP